MTGLSNVCVIGLCGVTCSGKTSLTRLLVDHYKNVSLNSNSQNSEPSTVKHAYCVESILMDDYFLLENDPRHVLIPELNHINWELMTSLDIDKMVSDVTSTIQRLKSSANPALYFIDGFLLFNCEKLKSFCDLKFFIDLNYETCFSRRTNRVYDPPDVPGYFEKVVWPESQKNKQLIIESTPDVIIIDGALPLNINFNTIKYCINKHLSSSEAA